MGGTVLVTGASSGFGAATAKRFAAEGRKVIIAARRQDRLNEIQAALPDPDKAHPVVIDVRDRDAVHDFVDNLPPGFADIDILVNNAGLALGMEGAAEADLDDWDTMVDTNIKGLMYMTRAILPGMVVRGVGHVVNLGSVAASWPYPGGNAYGGTKAFVQQFTRNMRADLLGKNIRVTNIEPGMCETEFSVVRFKGDSDKASQVYQGMEPLKGDDIAEMIYWVTQLPAHVNINQLEAMPVKQAWSPFAVHRE
jgi:3-hydroxy acid dehydrogenase/malonic semialdehyde reductase